MEWNEEGRAARRAPRGRGAPSASPLCSASYGAAARAHAPSMPASRRGRRASRCSRPRARRALPPARRRRRGAVRLRARREPVVDAPRARARRARRRRSGRLRVGHGRGDRGAADVAAGRRRAGGSRRRLPGVRELAEERLAPLGIATRLVPTDTEASSAAAEGAALVWLETPSNPRLDVGDIAAVSEAAHAAGALLAVDNTRRHGARPAAARTRRGRRDAGGHQEPVRALGRAARRRLDARRRSAPRSCAAGARSRARSPAASRRGSRTARWRRSGCGSSARASTRRRSPTRSDARRRARGACIRGARSRSAR